MTGTPSGATLPEKAAETSAEQPWPVRVLSLKIADYVDKMSPLWVEGQVVQINRRGTTAYLVLRDPDVDMSLAASISVHAIAAMGSPLDEGARVVLQAKPVFWPKRGTLMLDARQIRPVGVGDLWRGSRSSSSGSRRRDCSTPTGSGRCRSCHGRSGWSPAAGALPRRTSSRTPGAVGRRSGSRSARSPSRAVRRSPRSARR